MSSTVQELTHTTGLDEEEEEQQHLIMTIITVSSFCCNNYCAYVYKILVRLPISDINKNNRLTNYDTDNNNNNTVNIFLHGRHILFPSITGETFQRNEVDFLSAGFSHIYEPTEK